MQIFTSLISLLRVRHPDDQSLVDTLSLVILTGFAMLLIATIIVSVQGLSNPGHYFISTLSLAAMYLLLRAGFLPLTKFLAVSGILIFSSVMAITNYGLYTPAYPAMVLAILLAALLYSANMSLLVCALITGISAGIVISTGKGLLAVPEDRFLPLWLVWAIQSGIFILVTVMSYYVRRSVSKALNTSEASAMALMERNRELDIEINERIAANYALMRSEERYRTIVEDQPNFIVRWLPDGTITFANQKYCDDINRTKEEISGTNFLSWASQEAKDAILGKIYSLSPDNPVKISTHQAKNRYGESIWHQWSDRAIFDKEGTLIAVESIGTDVTSEKLLEQKLMQLEISEQRESFLQEFFSTMTHDLKTPLSVMNTSIYLARKTDDPDVREKHFDKLRQQISVQEKIINDILSMMQLNHLPGQNRSILHINEMIVTLIETLNSKAEAKNIELRKGLASDLPEFSGDSGQIDRLLLNVIENAINYTPENGQVSINTSTADDKIIIKVADTGIGIPEEEQDKIFSQFFRASNAEDMEGGTGLGLAIARRIAELHGGDLSLESEVNTGTTFTISLPLLPDEEQRASA